MIVYEDDRHFRTAGILEHARDRVAAGREGREQPLTILVAEVLKKVNDDQGVPHAPVRTPTNLVCHDRVVEPPVIAMIASSCTRRPFGRRVSPVVSRRRAAW